MRIVLPCLGVVLLLGACSYDKGFGPSERVDAVDYGSEWPLTVDSAVLTCDPGGALFITIDGRSFGLDGITEQNAPFKFERFWATGPAGGVTYKDLSPLLRSAQALCE